MTPTQFAGLPVQKTNAPTETLKGLCAVLFGDPGAGKTTAAAAISKSEYAGNVVIVDAEAGSDDVLKHYDMDRVPVTDWLQIKKFTEDYKKSQPWNTVILDNLSEIADQSLHHHMRTDPKGPKSYPELQHYGYMNEDIMVLSRTWRDIARNHGINVVICAWTAYDRDSAGNIARTTLGLNPKLADKFPGIIDIVGLITKKDDRARTRVMQFDVPDTAAKFRRSRTDVDASIPLDLYYGVDQAPLADILNTLRGGLPFPADKYKRNATDR